MNQKRKFISDAPAPEYLHEVTVTVNRRRRRLRKGMLVSVHRRPGLPAGQWEFCYAELVAAGRDGVVLVLHIEGPLARKRRHRTIRVPEIKTVHIKSEPRPARGKTA